MVQGIGFGGLYNAYNRIQYPVQNSDSAKELTNGKQQLEQNEQEVASVAKTPVMDLKLDSIRPRVDAPIEDISLSLNNPSPFEMKGSQSDINSLDISKAVSDMQKDEALWQYQYFVGDQQPIFQSEDGVVVAKPSMQ